MRGFERWRLGRIRDFRGLRGAAGRDGISGLRGVGSEGGLIGTGLGSGSPWLIPAAATDYVFVAVVEELGIAGGLALLAAFAMLIAVGFGIALRATDAFRSLLAAGLTIALAVQTLLIIGGVLRMLPLTGITLPFVSYGGSSLLANVVVISLLGRISHEERT